jgi:hypothetical protein
MNIYSVSIYTIGGPINLIPLPSTLHQEFLNMGNKCFIIIPKRRKAFEKRKVMERKSITHLIPAEAE